MPLHSGYWVLKLSVDKNLFLLKSYKVKIFLRDFAHKTGFSHTLLQYWLLLFFNIFFVTYFQLFTFIFEFFTHKFLPYFIIATVVKKHNTINASASTTVYFESTPSKVFDLFEP